MRTIATIFNLLAALLLALAPASAQVLMHRRKAFRAAPSGSPGTANLLAWWALENANDSSTNAYNGTTTGSVTYTSGHVGNAFTSSSDNSYVTRADADWMNMGGGTGMSLCAWVKATDATPAVSKGIIGHYSTSSQRSWTLNLNTDGTTVCALDDDGTSAISTTTTATLSDGTWTFIVATWEPSVAVKIYINGALSVTNTTSIPAALHNSTTSLDIGRYNVTSGNSWRGQLDEVAIFSDVLTAAEVTFLYGPLGAGRSFGDL